MYVDPRSSNCVVQGSAVLNFRKSVPSLLFAWPHKDEVGTKQYK